MEFGLIEHIYYKLLKVFFYQTYGSKTEEEYQRRKANLQERLDKAQEEFNKNPNSTNEMLLEKAQYHFIRNVSESDYKIALQDVENLKRQYIEEIPEKYWRYIHFTKIYYLMKSGGIKTLPKAIKYIEHYEN